MATLRSTATTGIGGSAISLWTPSIFSPVLWLDGKNSSSIVAPSGVISCVTAVQTYGLQTNSSFRPSYSSNRLVFESNKFLPLQQTDFGFMQGGDFTLAFSINSWTAGIVIGRAYNWGSFYVNAFGSNYRFNIGRTGIDEGNILRPIVTNNNVFVMRFSDSTNTLYVNDNGVEYSTSYTSSILHNSSDAPAIGCALTKSGVAVGFLSASIEEIVLLDSFKGTTDTQLLEGYLANRWGKTGNLPTGHPYKNSAPTV